MNRLKAIHRITRNSELFVELPETCTDVRGLVLKTYINGAQNGLFAEVPSENSAFACFIIDDTLPMGVHQYELVHNHCVYVSGRIEVASKPRSRLVYSRQGHTPMLCPVPPCDATVAPPPPQGSNVFGDCSC